MFIVPVVAAGCLAPLLVRAPRRAALGFGATAAFAVLAAVVTHVLHGRTRDVYTNADVAAPAACARAGRGLPG